MIPLHDGIPARRFPVVNVALIVANFAVFLFYELPDLNAAISQASFYPCDVTSACHLGIPWGVSWITAMFMHGNWHHIGGNMVFLAVFGKNVEDTFGRLGYLALYLTGGLVATVVQTAVTLHFGTVADAQDANLGASGAIAAVLGAYIVLYPRARIFAVWPRVAYIPAWFYLGFWIGFQLLEGNLALIRHADNTTGSHIGFFAHIGGFIFGVLVAIVLTRTGRITPAVADDATNRRGWWDRTLDDRDASARTLSMLDRPSAPAAPRTSTNVGCPNCGHVQAVPRNQPKYVCEQCNAHLERESTNIRCFKCGHVQTEPLSEATFKCEQCGTKLKRRTLLNNRKGG
jgi:membrane associated rhomboid family serine protease